MGGLGVSPSLVRMGQAQADKNAPLIQKNSHKDMWELSLIKTVLEHPELVDQILDSIDPSLLQFHSVEFSTALQGKLDEPSIMAIAVDEQIKPLRDEASLKAELIAFLTKHYERELRKINTQSSMSFEQKAFYIRKFRGKISKLKRGELVAFKD